MAHTAQGPLGLQLRRLRTGHCRGLWPRVVWRFSRLGSPPHEGSGRRVCWRCLPSLSHAPGLPVLSRPFLDQHLAFAIQDPTHACAAHIAAPLQRLQRTIKQKGCQHGRGLENITHHCWRGMRPFRFGTQKGMGKATAHTYPAAILLFKDSHPFVFFLETLSSRADGPHVHILCRRLCRPHVKGSRSSSCHCANLRLAGFTFSQDGAGGE